MLRYQRHYQDNFLCKAPFAIRQTESLASPASPVSDCTLIFGLCISFISVDSPVLFLCQCSQPVHVVQPWRNRTVLPRRIPLLQRCTLTSLWDQCRRRTRRTRSSGSQTCRRKRRRCALCHRPPVAQTAPVNWALITLMAPCTI